MYWSNTSIFRLIRCSSLHHSNKHNSRCLKVSLFQCEELNLNIFCTERSKSVVNGLTWFICLKVRLYILKRKKKSNRTKHNQTNQAFWNLCLEFKNKEIKNFRHNPTNLTCQLLVFVFICCWNIYLKIINKTHLIFHSHVINSLNPQENYPIIHQLDKTFSEFWVKNLGWLRLVNKI